MLKSKRMITSFTMLRISIVIASSIGGGLARDYSVTSYGARGDGKTDDTDAFLRAWDDACRQSTELSAILIPGGETFVLNQVSFEGPCKNEIHFQVEGNILRPDEIWLPPRGWITFHSVDGLTILGSGQIDGRGAAWWSCKLNRKCPPMAADALSVLNSNRVSIASLRMVDSPMMHLVVGFSSQVTIDSLRITAPGDSPNTDGIHVESSTDVFITDSIIGTGDDCVSIGTGTYNITVSGITCGPGHGISIGSLGGENTRATAERIHVERCNISGTTNGMRIKTWQGGSGYARTISFSEISLNAVENPIIIDQHYCNGGTHCQTETSAVQINGVKYSGVSGTTASDVAINLNCSASRPCTDIEMHDIYIRPAVPGRQIASECSHVRGTKNVKVVPAVSCST